MQNFTQVASKLLLEYRNLIKKHSPEDSAERLAIFGLNKKITDQDVVLYQTIIKILQVEGEDQLALKPSLRYSGITQFLNHLQEFIAEFRLFKGKVVHPGQASSRAMIELIQLLSLPHSRLNEAMSNRIQNSLWVIAKLGDEQQKSRLFNALEEQLNRLPLFFTPLLNKYSHFLNLDHAAEAEEEGLDEEEMIA